MSESTTRHRYRCDECDENGRWRISESAAANDALDHEHAEHPGALNYKTRVESEGA